MPKKRDPFKKRRGPRFGIEKPAIPGPGRPPMSPQQKFERKQFRDALDLASPDAIRRLHRATKSSNEKNAIRAAEVILSHTVPKLQEGVMHVDDQTPADKLPDEQLKHVLSQLIPETTGSDGGTTNGGNGAPA